MVTVDVSGPPPPAGPTGLTAQSTATGVALDWADGGADVAGYQVYRSAAAGGPFTRISGDLVTGSGWDDTMAPSGESFYQVTAVSSGGAESAPSGQANATMAKATLLVNPSFEIDANADNRPDSWTSSARFTRSTDAVRSGSYSGRHQTTSNANYTIGQTRNGLTAGTRYDLAGWVNIPTTSDSFTFSVQIQWRNSSNKAISTDTVASYSAGTNGWVKALGSVTAPAGTTRAVVNMVSSSLAGTVYVDDLTLR